MLANFERIIKLFTQNIVTKLSKVWVWDPGSEIRKKPIPDPGSRGQKGTGSRIRIRNTDLHAKSLLNVKISFLTIAVNKVRYPIRTLQVLVDKSYTCNTGNDLVPVGRYAYKLYTYKVLYAYLPIGTYIGSFMRLKTKCLTKKVKYNHRNKKTPFSM
jgi:hypothetical protein